MTRLELAAGVVLAALAPRAALAQTAASQISASLDAAAKDADIWDAAVWARAARGASAARTTPAANSNLVINASRGPLPAAPLDRQAALVPRAASQRL